MFLIEDKVKNAFIDIYFKDEGYLIKLHNNFLRQIKDVAGIIELEGEKYIDTGD